MNAPPRKDNLDDPLIGSLVAGKYQIQGFLGRGGIGGVYRGEQVEIEKPVAVKVLNARDPITQERFKREARAACKIGHPHIIDIMDFGVLDDGRHFFVMELLRGRNLLDLLQAEAPFNLLRTTRLMTQICSALAATHEMGIIHRDIKPENIFVVECEEEFIKLLDFGIAKITSREGDQKLTETGAVFGSPYYLSPEQANGEKVDLRTDIYSLGLVLYEMVTAKRAVDGNTVLEVVIKHVEQTPTPPAQVAPESPAAVTLNDVIVRAVAKRRERRYQTMKEFSDALRQAAEPGIMAELATGALPDLPSWTSGLYTPAARPRGLSMRKIILAVGLSLLAALLGAASALWRGSREPERIPVVAPPTLPPPPLVDAPPIKAVHHVAAKVAIQLVSVPPGAQVKVGKRAMGLTPRTIHLPRSTRPIWLLFELEGHEPTWRKVVPQAPQTVSVPLKRNM